MFQLHKALPVLMTPSLSCSPKLNSPRATRNDGGRKNCAYFHLNKLVFHSWFSASISVCQGTFSPLVCLFAVMEVLFLFVLHGVLSVCTLSVLSQKQEVSSVFYLKCTSGQILLWYCTGMTQGYVIITVCLFAKKPLPALNTVLYTLFKYLK